MHSNEAGQKQVEWKALDGCKGGKLIYLVDKNSDGYSRPKCQFISWLQLVAP